MNVESGDVSALKARILELERRLHEKRDALRAIRHGEVDAVVVSDETGAPQVYTLKGADRLYRHLIELMQEGALTIAEDGTVCYCNRRMYAMLGMAENLLTGRMLQSFMSSEDEAIFRRTLREVEVGRGRSELTLIAVDGRLVPVELSLNVLHPDGDASLFCGLVTDLTLRNDHLRSITSANTSLRHEIAERALAETLLHQDKLQSEIAERALAQEMLRQANEDLHQATSRLANQHELLRVTLQSIGEGVITTDADGRIDWLNPVAERLTGWTAHQAEGRPLAEVFRTVNETTRAPEPDPMAACLEPNKVTELASRTLLLSRGGAEFGIEESAAPIRSTRGETLGVVLVFRDVTEARRISSEISFRASHDALTGLLNRGEFEVRLRFLLHKALADDSEHALLLIDLDQFKLVNDSCGHAAGDLLLQQVSRLLTEVLRASDTLARLGGDEFAIILEHCAMPQAQRLAQRICDRMEESRFIHDGRRFRIGGSIGLVQVDQRWPDPAEVLRAADSSCFAAKDAGRNRVHLWSDTDQTIRARQGEAQLATRLAQALDEDCFVLFAQRLLPLQGNGGQQDRLHAEVLLRMVESDGSLAAPGAFLPAAERFHMVTRIDRWVLDHVIAWMRACPCLERIETLSVNLSGQSVGDRAFHRWAMERLSQAGDAICRRLCLEITETAAVTNLADAAVFFAQVRAIGVLVALDDFGAGASSFGYLKSLSVDLLKIDGQFIRDLVADALDEAAVRCFAEVAAVVGMRTVAEFVDSPAVLVKLRQMGIDFAQGYLIHRPSPIADLFEQPAELAGRVRAAR